MAQLNWSHLVTSVAGSCYLRLFGSLHCFLGVFLLIRFVTHRVITDINSVLRGERGPPEDPGSEEQSNLQDGMKNLYNNAAFNRAKLIIACITIFHSTLTDLAPWWQKGTPFQKFAIFISVDAGNVFLQLVIHNLCTLSSTLAFRGTKIVKY